MIISYDELKRSKHFKKRCRERKLILTEKNYKQSFIIKQDGEATFIGIKWSSRLTQVFVVVDNVIVTGYKMYTHKLKGAN